MPIFKLKKDELIKTWYRSHYEIEADTIEEAVNKIDEVDPYDSELLDLFEQDPLKIQILNEDGKILYAIKQL